MDCGKSKTIVATTWNLAGASTAQDFPMVSTSKDIGIKSARVRNLAVKSTSAAINLRKKLPASKKSVEKISNEKSTVKTCKKSAVKNSGEKSAVKNSGTKSAAKNSGTKSAKKTSKKSVVKTSKKSAVKNSYEKSSSVDQKPSIEELATVPPRTEVLACVRDDGKCFISEVASIPMKREIVSCSVCKLSDILARRMKKVWLSCGHICHKACFDRESPLPNSWYCSICVAGVQVMYMTEKSFVKKKNN